MCLFKKQSLLIFGLVLMLAASGGDGGGSAGRAMTFTVTVPLNTPVEENIFLISGPFKVYPMDKIGERV